MILVTGATGLTGGALVRRLSAAGVPVRALVRSPTRAEGLATLPEVEVVEGDMARPATLTQALHGVDRAMLISSADPAMLEVQSNFIDAAAQAGVGHVVKLTPGSRRSTSATSPRSPPTSSPARGHQGAVYPLTGPEALSMAEVAEKLSAATGKTIQYVNVAPEQVTSAQLAAGMPPFTAEALAELFAERRKGKEAQVSPVVQTILGRPATSFDQFAVRHAAVFRGEQPAPHV